MARGTGVSLCCLLLVVAALAAGASAEQEPSCFTSSNSALMQDAKRAFQLFKYNSGALVVCQDKCDGDKCTLLGKYVTAELKMCGKCRVCVPKFILERLFAEVMRDCVKDTDDGEVRVSGRIAPRDNFGVAIDGTKVDAGIKRTVSK